MTVEDEDVPEAVVRDVLEVVVDEAFKFSLQHGAGLRDHDLHARRRVVVTVVAFDVDAIRELVCERRIAVIVGGGVDDDGRRPDHAVASDRPDESDVEGRVIAEGDLEDAVQAAARELGCRQDLTAALVRVLPFLIKVVPSGGRHIT